MPRNPSSLMARRTRATGSPADGSSMKKPTNRPNAFLGSGFLPPNAYVTLDCEFVLVFRKGALRAFPPKDGRRRASQYTKAERDRDFIVQLLAQPHFSFAGRDDKWVAFGAAAQQAGRANFRCHQRCLELRHSRLRLQ